MIRICRWVYGANAPDDDIVMEPAPREDRTGASSGHTRARAQAGRKVKSGRLLPDQIGILRRRREDGEHEQPLGAGVADAVRRSFGGDQQDSRLHRNVVAFE